jgi:hypothetical protein
MKGNKPSSNDRLQKLLTKGKADPKTMTPIYTIVFQAVLLHGAESWVLMVTGTKNVTMLPPKMCEV